MPFKIIQLNSASPGVIAKLCADWSGYPDKLKTWGLSGGAIDAIRAGGQAKVIELIRAGSIYPPSLDIPGDELRWTAGHTGDIEKAPSFNRHMSLWNAYGGIHSLYIQKTVFATSGDGYKLSAGHPYEPLYNSSVYAGLYESFYYSGILAGYNYPVAQAYWSEGKSPEDDYNNFTSIYAPSDKLQVPQAMIRMGSDRARFNWRFEKSSAIGGDIAHFAKTQDYWVIGDMAIIGGNTPSQTKIVTDAGTVNGEVWYSSLSSPWIEYPDVWNGSFYKPLESPFGQWQLGGDESGMNELRETIKLHYDAMHEWYMAGCPSDWQDWGFYEHPEEKIKKADAKAAAIEKATRRTPIAAKSSDPPLDPDQGDLWYDFSAGKLKVFYADDNGKRWVAVE